MQNDSKRKTNAGYLLKNEFSLEFLVKLLLENENYIKMYIFFIIHYSNAYQKLYNQRIVKFY